MPPQLNSSNDLRYGIIGTGMMGVEHIHNLNALPGAQVTAISDPHEASRDAGVAAVGQPVRTFNHHQELLDAGDVDALVIASPNMTHVDVLLDALQTDIPILVEKPLCTTVDDCKQVLAAAENRSAMVWVGLEYRYMPPVARLLEEARAGTAGQLHMVSIREHRFPFLVKVGDWNRFSENTGGTLVEKCCHFFDLMTLITNSKPTRVYASGGQSVNHLDEVYDGRPSDILDNAFVVVDFESGARGLLDLCMFAEATHNQEEISVVGDAGKIEALIPENTLRIGRRGTHWIGGVESEPISDASVAFEGFHHGSSYIEHRRFLQSVREGLQPEVSLADGLLSVAVGEAAHRSIDLGRPVDLEEIL